MSRRAEDAPYDPDRSRRFVGEAESHLERVDVEGALASLRDALRFDPFDAEIPLLAGGLLHREGRPIDAAAEALRALWIRPFHPVASNMLAVCCMDAGRPDLAVAALERIVKHVPGFKAGKRNLKRARGLAKRPSRGQLAGELGDGIDAWLARPGDELTVCVVGRGDVEAMRRTLDAVEGLAAQLIVVDSVAPEALDPDGANRVFASIDPAIPPARAWTETVRRSGRDWVLALRAGETPADGAVAALEVARRRKAALAFAVDVHDERGTHRRTRLFRNAPGITFQGVLDPDPLPSLAGPLRAWGAKHLIAGVRIEASGVRSEPEPGIAREVLERMAAADAEAWWAPLELAALHLRAGDAEAASREAARARRLIEANRDGIGLERAVTAEGIALMRLERFEALDRLMRDFHRNGAPTGNTCFLEGVAARATGDSSGAVKVLSGLLDEPVPAFDPPLPEIRGAALHNVLGAALMDCGRLEDARRSFRRALSLDAESFEAQLGLLGVHLAEGEVREALEELDRMIERRGDEPRTWLTGEMILGHIPQLAETAVDWMEEGRRRHPQHARIRERLGRARLRCGDAELALEVWEGQPLAPCGQVADRLVARLVCGRELIDVPPGVREQIRDQVFDWFRRWMEVGAYTALDQALVQLGRLERELPGISRRTAEWLLTIGQDEAAARLRESG